MGNVNKAEKALIDERRTKLIELRRRKVGFGDPRVLDLGYASEQAASKDFYRALTERREAREAEVTAYREEQNEILDALHAKFWPLAMEQDLKAAEMILKILERQSKLNGWEAVLKAEVSGPDGGAIPLGSTLAELNQLIASAGEGGPQGSASVDEAAGDDSDT